ncbi:MAG: hypothetical protein GX610_21690 [Rhodococcus sp.]|nr:hypothetical protein [Rhodococcus sp. (in: high G+C Gram-positive bacteria)]
MAGDSGIADLLGAPFGGAQGLERINLGTKIDQLGEFIGQEADAPYVTDPDVFAGMSRDEMLGNVGNLNSQVITALGDTYMDIATEFGLAWALLKLKNIAGGQQWTGAAADAANAAVDRLSTPVSDTHASFQTIGLKMRQASSAAGDVKLQVESLLSGNQGMPLLMSSADAAAQRAQREQDRLEAARILETTYKPAFVDSGTNVPSIKPPPEIPGVDGSGSGFGSGWGSGGAPTGPGAGAPGVGGPDASTAGAPEAGAPGTLEGAGQEATAGLTSQAPVGADTPSATTAASAMPSGLGAGAPSSLGGSIPGAATGLGGGSGVGGGAAGGGFGGGGFAAGGPNGRPIFSPPAPSAGAAGSAAPTSSAASGAAAKPGAGRAPMMGMPMGRGAGGGQDGDTEHKTPDYLINIENGNELIGDIARVAPPVIGA